MIQRTKLEDYYLGDTLLAQEFELIYDSNSNPIILTDATIRMQFRLGSKNGRMLKELNTTNGITITDSLNGKFEIDETNSFLTIVGTYFYDVEITYASGQIETVLEGTINCKRDTSY